ncbi:MAG: PadR family transcriptional regulator [Dorea sp.]|nr:PadR family transcriptional regulator [Dorea sp.]
MNPFTLKTLLVIDKHESTIYPLLRRLQKENYLESVWKNSAQGLPPRKYYSLTSDGREYLEAMSQEWSHLTEAITNLKGEQS